MKRVVFLVILGICTLVSCEYFEQKPEGIPVARVEDRYLYREDIAALITPDMTSADSAIVVTNYIDRWATRQLLMEGARRNITQKEQQRLDNLVNQYQQDLYAQAYKDALVNRTLDTTISNQEEELIYEERVGNFKLNEDLYKLRYIHLNEDDLEVSEIKQRFKRYDTVDKKYLDSIAIQFKAQSLNDSIWINKGTIIEKINAITVENESEYLKKNDFLELRDSLGLYLISINEHLKRNDQAPLEYVRPTIRQIILNKRKLELIKELEKDITKDAIKNKQFEIYK